MRNKKECPSELHLYNSDEICVICGKEKNKITIMCKFCKLPNNCIGECIELTQYCFICKHCKKVNRIFNQYL